MVTHLVNRLIISDRPKGVIPGEYINGWFTGHGSGHEQNPR